MKRLLFCAALAVSVAFFESCAQHDPQSPDTSGNVPRTEPGAGVDTSNATTQPNTGGAPNSSNDGTNNNQQLNTGDTGKIRQ
jgi:hypothetical protein